MAEHFEFASTHLPNNQKADFVNKSTHQIPSTQQAQERIYRFLLDIVKQSPPEFVLQEFKRLFIQHIDLGSSDSIQAIYEIVRANDEEEFRSTIKRCCYILINNWNKNREYHYIQKFIELFATPIIRRQSLSPTINQLRIWVQNFVNSKEYQELKLFASAKYQEPCHWFNRYTSYLLVAQSADLKNPVEQREAAQCRANHLKYRFKFDLAMYMAHSQSVTVNKQSKNPTGLGDEVLRLIKIIVAKRSPSSYANIANTFIIQTKTQSYKQFKQSLQKYLSGAEDKRKFIDILKPKLDPLYEKYNEETLSDALLLRTCNRVIDYLTTENHHKPSSLFVLLMSQGNPLPLVIVLLKIILICRAARTHLETCIADLIQYYEDSPEKECNSIINFFEIFNIMCAVYADNMSVQLD